MARHPSVRWRARARAWVSDCGPRSESGRRRSVYFREHEGKALGPRDRHRATAALDAYLEERDRLEGAVDLADPTVEQLRLLYLTHCKAALSPEGYRQNRNGLQRFVDFRQGRGPRYGDVPARSLTAGQIQAWVDSLKAEGCAATYLARMYGSVQALLNWAGNPVPGRTPEQLLPGGNPVRGMKVRGLAAPPKVERFSETAATAAFLRFVRGTVAPGPRGAFDRNLLLLLRCLLRTGARPGELCELRWADVRWDAGRNSLGQIYATATLPPERWKTGRQALTRGRQPKARTIYLPPAIRRALLRERDREGADPVHIFTHMDNARGGGWDSPGLPWTGKGLAAKVRKLRRAAIAAGVPGLADEGPGRMVNYIHRHTFISRALMTGIDPVTIAELTGTSEAMIQRTYGHLLSDHLAGAMERIGRKKIQPS
jgi:integrase